MGFILMAAMVLTLQIQGPSRSTATSGGSAFVPTFNPVVFTRFSPPVVFIAGSPVIFN